MALISSAKRLFIPNKNQTDVKQPEYGNDMRAIEIFNPINKLVAGSGITLDPADGSGPQVEISSSGGGGSVTAGQMGAFRYAPAATSPFAILPITPGGAINIWGITDGTGDVQMFGSDLWIGEFGGVGTSHVITYPRLYGPNFTGGPLVVNSVEIQACDITMTNYLRAAAGPYNITSGGTVTTVQADYTVVTTVGPNLSLDATGIKTSATQVYFGAISVSFDYSACTFA